MATAIIRAQDGNFVICGDSYSFTGSSFLDFYLLKINANGDLLWQHSYADDDQESCFDVIQTADGGLLLTGTNDDNSIGYRQLYFLKTDAAGNKLWDKKASPSNFTWGLFTLELPNGDLATCGYHTNGFDKLLVRKSDASGNKIWETEIGNPNEEYKAYSMVANSDGSLTTAGEFSLFTSYIGDPDILLVNIDQGGNQLWQKKIGRSHIETGMNILPDNGNYIITGNTNDYGPQNADSSNIFTLRVDYQGNVIQ